MRQLALVPSGCQQWVPNPVAVSKDGSFAYSSALAVYVFSNQKGRISLARILARVTHSVTSITWHPSDPNMLAMVCADLSMKVIQLDTELEVASGTSKVGGKNAMPTMKWSLHDPKSIFVYGGNGLMLWNYGSGVSNVIRSKGNTITALAQSCKQPTKIAVGYSDGVIFIYDLASKKGTEVPGEIRITSLAFDPLSNDYLLVAYWNGFTKLLMANEGGQDAPGTAFSKQPTGHRTVAFIDTMPGTFVSVSDRSGVMQVWNVSQSDPIQRLRIGQGGLQSVTHIEHTAEVVATVKDGTVVLYNLEQRRAKWQTRGGHTETIFGCSFHPDNPNLLATCSYDSTIRLWDLTTLESVKTLVGAKGVLYSVTWSPDGSQLATSSSTGGVFIFDVEKGTLLKTTNHHKDAAYRVEWHPTETNLLASASTDRACAVFRADGTLTRSFSHPKGICSVAWCPHQRLILATTCEDSNIYIWNAEPSKGELLKTLKGHRARVFNVAWNPLIQGVLLSGSDDNCARVWNIDTGSSIELTGHTSNVRGLLWHTEMPNVCITGSWDSTMRVWDTREGVCIKTVQDHHADVYGIACHRRQPFAVASTSRDTTLRLWDLNSTFPLVAARAACGENIRGGAASVATPPGELCGPTSRSLWESASASSDELQRLTLLVGLLSPPGAPAELWDLASIIESGGRRKMLSVKNPQIPHVSSVQIVLNSKAQELEMQKNLKARGIGSTKKEDVLRSAAAAHLVAGNFESYCKLCAEVGDWTEALAVAPAVGLGFWQKLVKQRATSLKESGATTEAMKPYLLAGGQVSLLIQSLMNSQLHNEAFQIAAVNSEGGYVPDYSEVPANGSLSSSLRANKAGDKAPVTVRRAQAAELMTDSKPVHAACCHLAVNDVEGALKCLHQGHEVVLAAALAIALKASTRDTYVEALARHCEAHGDWSLAGKLLRMFGRDNEYRTELLGVRVSSFKPDLRSSIYSSLGMRRAEDYQQMAETEPGGPQRAYLLLLSGDFSAAASHCVQVINSNLASGDVPDDLAVQVLMSIPAIQLKQQQRTEVLLLAFYIGAAKAIQLGYLSMAPFLVAMVKQLGGDAFVTALRSMMDGSQAGPEVRIAGSDIPSGGSRDSNHISIISRTRIQGPHVLLEDQQSRISLAEAVMLSRVMTFSPLASGTWLMV